MSLSHALGGITSVPSLPCNTARWVTPNVPERGPALNLHDCHFEGPVFGVAPLLLALLLLKSDRRDC
jgi:hypothetical protein